MKLLDKLRWDLRVASGAMGFTLTKWEENWKLGIGRYLDPKHIAKTPSLRRYLED